MHGFFSHFNARIVDYPMYKLKPFWDLLLHKLGFFPVQGYTFTMNLISILSVFTCLHFRF